MQRLFVQMGLYLSNPIQNIAKCNVWPLLVGDYSINTVSPTVAEAWESVRQGVKPRVNRDRLDTGGIIQRHTGEILASTGLIADKSDRVTNLYKALLVYQTSLFLLRQE